MGIRVLLPDINRSEVHYRAETLGFLISTHPLTLYEPRLRGLQYIQAFRCYAHLIDLNEPFVLRGRITDDHGCVTLNVTHVDTRLFYRIPETQLYLEEFPLKETHHPIVTTFEVAVHG